MPEGLRLDREGEILTLTLDRPKANAISDGLSRALGEAFIAYRDDRTLRVAIVTGAGDKFFSAGWDLKAAAATGPADYGPGGFAGLTELFDLDKPVIAAINGMAVGGGFELALCCDVIVAEVHAEFFLPEAGIGLIPDAGGVFRLPRRLPEALAHEMLMTGRRLRAEEALAFGLVNHVTPTGGSLAKARTIAAAMLRSAPLSLAAIKQAHRLTRHLSVEEAYKAFAAGRVPAYDRMKKSADYWEGAKAFAEKREPRWSGE
jgi:crotonobetainyl-CoA hydratase